MKIIKSYVPSLFFFFFINLVNYIKFLFKEAFIHLGLLKPPPPPEPEYHSGDGYVLLRDSRSKSIVPVPVQVVTGMIKDNLPVLEYGDFVGTFGHDEDEEMKKDDKGNMVCTVCLDLMETNDEMRELCMCVHVFHKECIDTWVDEGRVTCPLCRSTLYPDPMDWPTRPAKIIVDYDVNY